MAAVEEPRCRGCGTPVPSGSTGRRLLTGLSSNQMLSAWKDLLREKLDSYVERVCKRRSEQVWLRVQKMFSILPELQRHEA